jgi:Cu/Ag efflux protein CusF
MRKIMLSAAAAAVVLSGPVAFAATAAAKSETGVIAQIDTKAPSITLKSGKIKTFFLGKEIALADFKVGEKVTVTYEMVSKKPTASAVIAAK